MAENSSRMAAEQQKTITHHLGMSFTRRSSAFAASAATACMFELPHTAHDYFYDNNDIQMLQAGGLPKLAEVRHDV
jgi:hypothetical protein